MVNNHSDFSLRFINGRRFPYIQNPARLHPAPASGISYPSTEMKLNRRSLLLQTTAATLLLPLSSARPASAQAPADPSVDGVEWVTLKNGYRVWTQRIGRGRTKVLLLHGGPGFSHDYMQCFADFLPAEGYQMYFYDQLGCGKSERPDDTKLWTLPRYLEEVEEVCAALGLDDFVLIGHSWGGMLAIEYALRYPGRLRSMVISDMTASFADFAAYTTHLKSELPAPVRGSLDALERAGLSGSDEYGAILQRELYPRYICRLKPWPQPLQRSFAIANQVIYNQMQGPNEFVITGNLRDWDRWGSLSSIKTPTLVMGARYDEMNPDSIRREASLIPNATLFISETGSHLAMWDDQENYFSALLQFLAASSGHT